MTSHNASEHARGGHTRPGDVMGGESEQPDSNEPQGADDLQMRRSMLRIGSLATVAVVTIRPGLAQAASSALTCSVPVPQGTDKNKWIAADGSLVKKNKSGAYAPPSSPLAGEDVKNSLKYGTNYPGYSSAQTSAYNNYIKKLTMGKQGYTCYASLQNPGRK